MSVLTDTRVKPHVRAAAKEIMEQFGVTNIGGFATTGHIPNSDHYTGHALDVMTSLKGQQVADWAKLNASRLGVKYIIWNRRIWTAKTNEDKAYTGTSPHTDHVHISFNTTPGDGSAPVDSVAGGQSTQNDGCLQLLLDLFNPLK